MFEDMLDYSSDHLAESFYDLLGAQLDDDAQLFYLRMATDIAAVAGGVGIPSHPARKMLLAALVAGPPDGASSWRQLYREIAAMVAGYPTAEFRGPVGRLRGFLAENVDFADALAIEELERAMFGHVIGA
jgi:hypothetical protein